MRRHSAGHLPGIDAFGAAVMPEASEPPYDFAHMLVTDLVANGVRLTSSNSRRLIPPIAIWTAGAGINARGDIVGSYVEANGKHHGFLLSAGDSHEGAESNAPESSAEPVGSQIIQLQYQDQGSTP